MIVHQEHRGHFSANTKAKDIQKPKFSPTDIDRIYDAPHLTLYGPGQVA